MADEDYVVRDKQGREVGTIERRPEARRSGEHFEPGLGGLIGATFWAGVLAFIAGWASLGLVLSGFYRITTGVAETERAFGVAYGGAVYIAFGWAGWIAIRYIGRHGRIILEESLTLVVGIGMLVSVVLFFRWLY